MQNGFIWAIDRGVEFFILVPNVYNMRENVLIWGANGLQTIIHTYNRKIAFSRTNFVMVYRVHSIYVYYVEK